MSSLDFLHGIDVIEIIDGARPIRTAKSSVIGIVGTAGKGPVNAPVLVLGNLREAVSAFGRSKGDGFTLPAALKAIFDVTGATIVAINVADPTVHFANQTSAVATFNGNTLKLPRGYVRDFVTTTTVKAPYTVETAGVVPVPAGATRTGVRNEEDTADVTPSSVTVGQKVIVIYTATLVNGVDYTLDVESGTLTRPSTGSKLLPNSTIMASYKYVDPAAADESDIIGEVGDDEALSGIQALAGAKSSVHVQPRILIAPGFTMDKPNAATANPVAVALNVMANRLKAVAVLDTPNTTREDAVAYTLDFGGSDRIYTHFPFYRILNPSGDGTIVAEPASARIAGIIARTDNEEGFWVSPSNKVVPGIVGLDKPIDFSLSSPDSVANYLNMNNTATTISEQGIRLWGNRVANAAFLSGRRIADMVEESILMNHLWAVDKNITKAFVETVVEGVNDYMRTLKRVGAILGGKAWADPTLNTPSVIAEGQLYIDFEFTRPTPAEHLTFRAHLVNDYITEIFDINT